MEKNLEKNDLPKTQKKLAPINSAAEDKKNQPSRFNVTPCSEAI